MVAATGAGDRAELDTLAEHLAGLGRSVDRLTGRELRRLEPGLGPDVRGGLSVPDDLAVDNRVLLAALRAAAERAGVRFVAEPVAGRAGRRRAGHRGAQRRRGDRPAERVLVAAGAHSAGLHPTLRGLVRPVKGEVLRLAHRAGALPLPTPHGAGAGGRSSGVRGAAGRRRAGGRGDPDEQGFDTEVTVGGVRDLLRDAERVLPGIAEYALVESAAGLRPGSPDNLPLIGAPGPAGLFVATGHHRNGMLLAPITAEAVLALLAGEPVPDPVRVADPRRFAATRGVRPAGR